MNDKFEEILALPLTEINSLKLVDLGQALTWLAKNASDNFKKAEDSISALDYLTNLFISRQAELKMVHGEVDWLFIFHSLRLGKGNHAGFTFVTKVFKGETVLYQDIHVLILNDAMQINNLNVPFHMSGFADRVTKDFSHQPE